jgi:hypothetical protein
MLTRHELLINKKTFVKISAESGKEPPGFNQGDELPRALARLRLSHIFGIDKISEL